MYEMRHLWRNQRVFVMNAPGKNSFSGSSLGNLGRAADFGPSCASFFAQGAVHRSRARRKP